VYLVVTWSLSSQTSGTAQESGRPLLGSLIQQKESVVIDHDCRSH
jgi:hypothetical protein